MYKQKYLKYKKKFLNMKYHQSGGASSFRWEPEYNIKSINHDSIELEIFANSGRDNNTSNYTPRTEFNSYSDNLYSYKIKKNLDPSYLPLISVKGNDSSHIITGLDEDTKYDIQFTIFRGTSNRRTKYNGFTVETKKKSKIGKYVSNIMKEYNLVPLKLYYMDKDHFLLNQNKEKASK